MTDNVETTQTTLEPAPGAEQQRAWDNPMLSRNAQAAQPREDAPAAEEEPAPVAKAPTLPSESQPRASAMDVLGDLAQDPQFAPVALYLDEQLAAGSIDADRAFSKAIEYGDPNLIDEAYLKEALGDKAAGVLKMAQSLFVAAEAKANAVVQQVYTQFGGKANVDQAVKFMNEKAPPEMRAAMVALLDSGQQQNIAYAVKQIVDFAGKAGAVRQIGGPLPLGTPSAQRGLSAEAYRAELGKLPWNASDSQFQALADLRKLGKQQGL